MINRQWQRKFHRRRNDYGWWGVQGRHAKVGLELFEPYCTALKSDHEAPKAQIAGVASGHQPHYLRIDMTDIVERLRRGFGGLVRPICEESANEIESLRQQLSEAHRALAKEKAMLADYEHRANEWADAAINGLQWLRNVRDGIANVSEAIEKMENDITHCRKEGEANGKKFIPDWDELEAARESLREHMRMVKDLQKQLASRNSEIESLRQQLTETRIKFIEACDSIIASGNEKPDDNT